MDQDAILKKVEEETKKIYSDLPHPLPFHGWHHIFFVRKQALRFCAELKADPFLVEIAALVHDLNYVAKTDSGVAGGKDLRTTILQTCGLDQEIIGKIEDIVCYGDISTRDSDISPEAQALSDGDTLFKTLPITPILFARLFMEEKNTKLEKMARRIVEIQRPLFDQELYFYSNGAKNI